MGCLPFGFPLNQPDNTQTNAISYECIFWRVLVHRKAKHDLLGFLLSALPHAQYRIGFPHLTPFARLPCPAISPSGQQNGGPCANRSPRHLLSASVAKRTGWGPLDFSGKLWVDFVGHCAKRQFLPARPSQTTEDYRCESVFF